MASWTMDLSDLSEKLTDTSEGSVVADHTSDDAVVIDRPDLAHMVLPKNNCTVEKYCKICIKYVLNFFYSRNKKMICIRCVFRVEFEKRSSCMKRPSSNHDN